MENQRLGVKELAKILGITPRRVQQLVEEGVLERDSRGQYTLGDCVRAYCGYLGSREPAASTALDAERTKALALQNAIREKALIPYDLAEGLVAEIIGAIRAGESTLPVRIAKSRLDRAEIERITLIVEDMQREVARELDKTKRRFEIELESKTASRA